MVVIRLLRAGAKKRPFYNVIVTDNHKRRDVGKYIEDIGYFNPVARGQEVRLHLDLNKVTHWKKLGAQLSSRVDSLIKEFSKKHASAE